MEICLTKSQSGKDALRHRFRASICLGARSEFHDSLIRHGGGLLRKKANAHPALHRHKPLIRFVITEQQGKKRGFPRPVRTDKSNAVARVDLQGGLLK